MKTLDEVIKMAEHCWAPMPDSICATCPSKQRPIDCSLHAAVLFHLYEYRSEKRIWETERKHYEDWIEQYKDARDKHQQAVIEMLKNPPLTWDELKGMEGKPVWVEEYWMPSEDEEGVTEDSEPDCDKYWAIMNIGPYKIHVIGENCDQFLYAYENGNATAHQWQAYRKERWDEDAA